MKKADTSFNVYSDETITLKGESALYKQFTTDLLQLPNFELINSSDRGKNYWILDIEPRPQTYICPCCFQLSTNHARSSKRTLRHAWVSTGKTIYIRIPVHRQRCDDCGITWTVEWPEIPSRGKVTHHFKTMIARKCIGQSFEAVSREMNVPASTVSHWFYDYGKRVLAQPGDYEAPEALCIDEFALKKGHSYSIALQDANTGHVWQTTPGKSREKVQEALRQYPFPAPKVVVTDMAPGMDKTIREVWPKTDVVVDKFHVIQLFTRALENARKLDRNYATKHLEIRHQRRLLMIKPSQLSVQERQKLRQWLNHNTVLEKQYAALQDFRKFYESTSYEEAQLQLDSWCKYYLLEGAGATKRITTTILKWKEEVLNYFRYRLTNARLEGTNNLIKTIKRRSYGCPNLKKFEIRIRLECKQPA